MKAREVRPRLAAREVAEGRTRPPPAHSPRSTGPKDTLLPADLALSEGARRGLAPASPRPVLSSPEPSSRRLTSGSPGARRDALRELAADLVDAVAAHDLVRAEALAARLGGEGEALRQTLACRAAARGQLGLASILAAACVDGAEARFWIARQLVIGDALTPESLGARPTLSRQTLLRLLDTAVSFGRVAATRLVLDAAGPLSRDQMRAALRTAAHFPRPAIVAELCADAPPGSWEREVAAVKNPAGPAELALLDALEADDDAAVEALRSAGVQTLHSCLGDILSHAVALKRGGLLLRCVREQVLDEAACRDSLMSDGTTYSVTLSAHCSDDRPALSLIAKLGDPREMRRAEQDSFGDLLERADSDASRPSKLRRTRARSSLERDSPLDILASVAASDEAGAASRARPEVASPPRSTAGAPAATAAPAPPEGELERMRRRIEGLEETVERLQWTIAELRAQGGGLAADAAGPSLDRTRHIAPGVGSGEALAGAGPAARILPRK